MASCGRPRVTGLTTECAAAPGVVGSVFAPDFTELHFADGHRRAYLIPIIGHYGKMVYGWAAGLGAS